MSESQGKAQCGDDSEVRALVDRYGNMIFRICYMILCDRSDAEDALQETYLRYLTHAPDFVSEEHEKAWLIRVATNISKNMVMFRLRRADIDIDELRDIGIEENDTDIFEAITSLPVKIKIVMVLYYVEGYRAFEIADITGISAEAVRKRLQKGRELLRIEYERCELDENGD